ncbi:MAG TPA: SiaB family protein kinase [Flavobacteriales bacterium]|nr:SiaB family protein kinase [Flavobacteriales bacterium]
MIDIFDFYNKMERNNIMLSFKGGVTSELLTSILQIMESKLDNLEEQPKTKKKVFNVLVECLQNLYHHIDEAPSMDNPLGGNSAIFMISRHDDHYSILTGNFIVAENVKVLRDRIDVVNGMDKEALKEYYKVVLNNGEMSAKGGGGLGIIDIARKSGQKLEYSFQQVDDATSFFSLNVKVAQ